MILRQQNRHVQIPFCFFYPDNALPIPGSQAQKAPLTIVNPRAVSPKPDARYKRGHDNVERDATARLFVIAAPQPAADADGVDSFGTASVVAGLGKT